MKLKKTGWISIVLVSVSLSGCYSVQLENLNRINKAALLSVYCSNDIDMSDFQGVAAMYSKLFQSTDFDLIPVVDSIKTNFLTKYTGVFPFELLPEEKVVKHPAYLALYNNFFGQLGRFLKITVPKDYIRVSITDYAQMAQLTSQIPEADGSIVVYMSFKLEKQGEFLGFGSAVMLARMDVCVRTVDNQNAIALAFYGKSKNVLKYSLGGVFDAKQIKDLCIDATEVALVDCYDTLQQQIAYHTQRLAREGKPIQPKPTKIPTPNPVQVQATQPTLLASAPAITEEPEPMIEYVAEAPNQVHQRGSVHFMIGEHQFILEDLNRSVIANTNTFLDYLGSQASSVTHMSEIKGNFGMTTQFEYGITDNLILSSEYTYIPMEREGMMLLTDPATHANLKYSAKLSLPIQAAGLNIKLAVPASTHMLFKFGAGLEYLDLYGRYSHELFQNGVRQGYMDYTFSGECFGTNLSAGFDLFLNRNIALGFELGYRMAVMEEIIDEKGATIKMLETGKDMSINFTGMTTRAGVVVWF